MGASFPHDKNPRRKISVSINANRGMRSGCRVPVGGAQPNGHKPRPMDGRTGSDEEGPGTTPSGTETRSPNSYGAAVRYWSTGRIV